MRTILTSITALVLCGATACHRRAPDTPLSRAAAAGDAAQVRALLTSGTAPDAAGPSDITPLMWAARAGHVPVLKALLEAGAKPDVRERGDAGWTALVHAIHKRQGEAARVLLEAGSDPNLRMAGGVTPLMFAASYGDTSLVHALLERGADPRAEAEDGVTALWAAVGGGAILDFTDGPPLGSCFPDAARAILEKAPELKLTKSASSKVVRLLGRSQECSELIARLQ